SGGGGGDRELDLFDGSAGRCPVAGADTEGVVEQGTGAREAGRGPASPTEDFIMAGDDASRCAAAVRSVFRGGGGQLRTGVVDAENAPATGGIDGVPDDDAVGDSGGGGGADDVVGGVAVGSD